MAANPIYQFYAELKNYQPTMWRRFQVSNNITMARFGYILMTLFEMEASHLFSFDVPYAVNIQRHGRSSESGRLIELFKRPSLTSTLHFELYEEEAPFCVTAQRMEASGTGLKYAVDTAGDEMTFTYDFSDCWELHVVLEKVITDKELPAKLLPRVLEGVGCGILENAGGPSNLMDIRAIFQSKRGKKYRELCEWLGAAELDLDTFDLDDMNYRLKHVPRIYMGLYERDGTLTKHSLAILDREYKTS